MTEIEKRDLLDQIDSAITMALINQMHTDPFFKGDKGNETQHKLWKDEEKRLRRIREMASKVKVRASRKGDR